MRTRFMTTLILVTCLLVSGQALAQPRTQDCPDEQPINRGVGPAPNPGGLSPRSAHSQDERVKDERVKWGRHHAHGGLSLKNDCQGHV